MARLSEIGRRVRMLFRGAQFDRELEEEMQLHLQLRQERLHAEGLSESDANVVVGIVKDSGLSEARGNRGGGEAYVPVSDERLSRVALLVHTSGDPRALLRDARAAASPSGLTPTATMMEATLNLPAPGGAGLIAMLGSLAMMLAFTGIFGLVSFAVAQQTREIAVRLALGARWPHVLHTVLARYGTPLIAGSVAGIGLALAASQVLRGQLHGLAPLDPISYATGIAGVGAVAVAAMLLPARRALRINPASALRSEQSRASVSDLVVWRNH